MSNIFNSHCAVNAIPRMQTKKTRQKRESGLQGNWERDDGPGVGNGLIFKLRRNLSHPTQKPPSPKRGGPYNQFAL